MSCKIIIPSHKRADRVFSSKLVHNAIICVEQSQLNLYREYNPDNEIVCHPDNIKGLVPKRNWMLNHFGDLFMIDDDVNYFHRVYQNIGEPAKINSASEITEKIYQLYDLAKLLEVPLFGFTKNPRPEHYNEFKPFWFSQMITGCAYGVIKKPFVKWNEDIKLKEDFYISCIVKFHYRKILVDTRYNFTQLDTFKNPGGLSDIRNHDEELRSILMIKKHFGDTIRFKINRKNSKLVKKYDISAFFKF
jgi:hypothetical protein